MSTNIDKLLQDLSVALRSSGVSSISTGKGINDSATREQIIINDTGVLVGILKVERVSGNLSVDKSVSTHDLRVVNNADINNLRVTGKLTADLLQVKKIVSDQSNDVYSKPVIFSSEQPEDLDGKGFLWSEPEFTHQFIFKSESKSIFSTSHINLHRNSKYKIDGVDVLDYDRLGQKVQYSNLKSVGILEKLKVKGDTYLGDTVYVNTSLGRLGVNTDKPNAAFSVVDNLVEVIIGSNNDSRASIGTWSSHGLDIVTDNTKRISISGNIVEFGNFNSKNATVKIHGILEVDTLVAKTMQQDMSNVGSMQSLTVAKNANIGSIFFVNSQAAKVGINTETPYGAFSVVDKDVEFTVGSTGNGRIYIGAPKSQGLDIFVNGKNRVSISNSTVEFGSEKDNDTVVKVNGTIVANNIISKKTTDIFSRSVTFDNNERKGLEWPENKYLILDDKCFQLSSSVNLNNSSSYRINDVEVLSKSQLGTTVINSNLKSVGELDYLKVIGSSNFGSTVFVDSVNKRVGINTDSPNAALSVSSNSVEVIVSNVDNSGYIGTVSTSLILGNKNLHNITINNNTVDFGSSSNKGIVRIHGTLEVDNFIAKIEQSGPVEFNPSADTGVYSKGLLWKSPGSYKKFFLMPGPDRFQSTETIDLATNKVFSIANKLVLSSTELGETVVSSKLTKVGNLVTLTVNGAVNLADTLTISADKNITIQQSLNINDGTGLLKISSNDITTTTGKGFKIVVNDSSIFSADAENNITLGNKENSNKTISLQGKLALNVSNPDQSVAFTVVGGVSIDGKKFINVEAPPTTGNFSKGDIAWNINPQETSYVGWVCVISGNPGTWKPFGVIGR
jgi:hypothetical protein